VIGALDRRDRAGDGQDASLVASPGTYDHKHVARIAGVPHCVAYGPGSWIWRISPMTTAVSRTSSSPRKCSRFGDEAGFMKVLGS
jgi:hypothetical protein